MHSLLVFKNNSHCACAKVAFWEQLLWSTAFPFVSCCHESSLSVWRCSVTAFTLFIICLVGITWFMSWQSIPMMFHDLCCVSIISFITLIWCYMGSHKYPMLYPAPSHSAITNILLNIQINHGILFVRGFRNNSYDQYLLND